MGPNQKPSEIVAVLGVIAPVSQAAGAVSTGWVSVKNFYAIMATIQTGVLGASATLDAKIEQATTSGGAGVKDVTGKAITQIVKASGDGKQATITVRPQDLDTNGGFAFVRLTLTVGTATSLIGALLQGFYAKFGPVRDPNASPAVNLGAATVVQDV